MNRVLLQLWEETVLNEGVFTDGCSLHLNVFEKKDFISKIYENRPEAPPPSYDRILGSEIPVFISDELFDIVKVKKNIKLSEVEFRNLIIFEDIIFNTSTI